MLNIAVLVSGGGSNLQALINARDIFPNAVLALAISSRPGVYALERAEKAGMKTVVVEKKSHPDRAEFTRIIMNELEKENIGLVVFAGFLTVLSPFFCEKYENRAINLHPALIPAFCGDGYYGLRVHRAVLDYGVKLTGATVIFVTPETDGGPIIAQRAIPVLEEDTPESLQKRVTEQCEWPLLCESVRLFCENRLVVEGRTVRVLPPRGL